MATERNLATEKRLESLIESHYYGAKASPSASAFRDGWYAAKRNAGRDTCPHSNVYKTPKEAQCFDGAFYVKLYMNWNYGYDAYLRWSTSPEKSEAG